MKSLREPAPVSGGHQADKVILAPYNLGQLVRANINTGLEPNPQFLACSTHLGMFLNQVSLTEGTNLVAALRQENV